MAGRPAPRPKSAKAAARPSAAHSTSARAYRRVKETQKWNKGPAA